MTILGGVLALNCGDKDANGVGQLQLALTMPGGITINSVDWKVLSATSTVVLSGTINTSDPNLQPSVIAGLPAGTGDVVTMSAVTTMGVSCAGTSGQFNVVPGMPVGVTVNLTCGQMMGGPGLGTATITGNVVAGDSCPVFTAYMLTPGSATAPTGTIAVSVAATDADMAETVSFAWTASAGSFASPSMASTTYTCTTAGTQTLTAAISDNHTPTACTTQLSFTVDCQ